MTHVFVWAASLRILLVWTTKGGTRERLALIAFRGLLNIEESRCRRRRSGRRGRASQTATPRGAIVNGFWRTFEYQGIALAVTVDRVWSALIAFHRPGARGGAGVRCRETPSPIVFDDFIAPAFQRGIGATRPAGKVCRSVRRTCDGHARSLRVRRDNRGGPRALSSLPPFYG